MLIARIPDKRALPPPLTYNLQMMRCNLHEEDPKVNIMHRSGITTGDDQGKQLEDSTWIPKALVKESEVDLESA